MPPFSIWMDLFWFEVQKIHTETLLPILERSQSCISKNSNSTRGTCAGFWWLQHPWTIWEKWSVCACYMEGIWGWRVNIEHHCVCVDMSRWGENIIYKLHIFRSSSWVSVKFMSGMWPGRSHACCRPFGIFWSDAPSRGRTLWYS